MKFGINNIGKIFAVFGFFMLTFVPFWALAQDPVGNPNTDPTSPGNTSPTTVTIVNPIKVSTLNGFIKILLEGVIKIGIPLIALALVYSGYLFVTATGNSEKINKAKDAFIYALIGGAVLLGSWAIAQMISDTVLSIS